MLVVGQSIDLLIVHAPSPITMNKHLSLSHVYEENNTDNKVIKSKDNKVIFNSNFKMNLKNLLVKMF